MAEIDEEELPEQRTVLVAKCVEECGMLTFLERLRWEKAVDWVLRLKRWGRKFSTSKALEVTRDEACNAVFRLMQGDVRERWENGDEGI